MLLPFYLLMRHQIVTNLHSTFFTIQPERRDCMRFLSEEVIASSFYLSQLFATWAPCTKQGGGYPQQSAAYLSPGQPVAQGAYTPQVLELEGRGSVLRRGRGFRRRGRRGREREGGRGREREQTSRANSSEMFTLSTPLICHSACLKLSAGAIRLCPQFMAAILHLTLFSVETERRECMGFSIIH